MTWRSLEDRRHDQQSHPDDRLRPAEREPAVDDGDEARMPIKPAQCPGVSGGRPESAGAERSDVQPNLGLGWPPAGEVCSESLGIS